MRIKLLIITLLLLKVIGIAIFFTYFKPFRKNEQIVLNAIHSRTSIREYTEKEVPAQLVEELLKAAMAAPSSRNMQPWEFYVVTERESLDRLAEGLPFAKMLARAPLAIVVAGNTQVGNPNQEQVYNWVMDCSAATQNLLLAAHAVGLGAVWTGVWPYESRIDVVRKALDLPEHIIPLNVIPVGYPEREHEPKIKWDTTKVHWPSNTQHPIANSQYPTPNSQYPTPNNHEKFAKDIDCSHAGCDGRLPVPPGESGPDHCQCRHLHIG